MITQKLLKELFKYHTESGLMTRKTTPANNALVGSPVGGVNGKGYLQAKIHGKSYLVHRLIFLYHHGYLPEFIDHSDCDPLNNKIDNLRECTRGQNNRNSRLRSDSTTGIKGVSWSKRDKVWRASIRFENQVFNLGIFRNIDSAALAIKSKRDELHGRFTNHG